MKFRSIWLGLVMSVFAAASAYAETGDSVQGDAARGKVLAYTCHGCHGIEGYKNVYPTYSVPKLGSQNEAYLASALQSYATGDRAHPTMHAHAASLSLQERADIAAFFAATPMRAAGQVSGTPPAASATCTSCHGADGIGISGIYPNLAGQHRDYLEHSLRDYKSGKRKNPIMAGIMSGVDVKDIPALAKFFASQKTALCSTDEIREHGKCK